MNNDVQLLGYFGGDEAHATAAWASTGGITDEKRLRMGALLKMLAESGHGTPFEHSTLQFLVTADIASHIHFLKHRAGVSINSESARYKELSDKCYLPHDWSEDERIALHGWVLEAFDLYHACINRLVAAGMPRKRAKESARFYLPYASQLTFVVTMNFRAFVHFQRLRNDEHAQLEIREIAEAMLQLVKGTNAFTYSLEAHGWL